MLRVIAGEYGSRKLATLDSYDTRPTLDKTRGAIFNRIGPYFSGGSFLDLFAGSGAMGIEAISRGMNRAVFVDKSSAAVRIIRQNLSSLKIECAEVHCVSYQTYLRSADEQFDCIYIDPPYHMDVYQDAISRILERNLLKDGGRLILESAKEKQFDFSNCELILEKEAVYGISKVTYLRKGTE